MAAVGSYSVKCVLESTEGTIVLTADNQSERLVDVSTEKVSLTISKVSIKVIRHTISRIFRVLFLAECTTIRGQRAEVRVPM